MARMLGALTLNELAVLEKMLKVEVDELYYGCHVHNLAIVVSENI